MIYISNKQSSDTYSTFKYLHTFFHIIAQKNIRIHIIKILNNINNNK